MTFGGKLAAMIIALGIVVVSILTFVMAGHNSRQLVDVTLENNGSIAAAIAIHMDNYLDELVKTTRTLATTPLIGAGLAASNRRSEQLSDSDRKKQIEAFENKWLLIENDDDPFLQQYLINPVAQHLREQETVSPDLYGEIFLTNKYGELVAATGRLTNFKHNEKYWWKAGFNDGLGQVFLDDRGYDASVGDFVLGVVVPVYVDEQVVGILKSNMRIFKLFSKIVNNYSPLYAPGVIKIARTDGVVVLEPDHDPLSTEFDEKFLPSCELCATSLIHETDEGEQMLINVSPIEGTTSLGKFSFGGSAESEDHSLGNKGAHWTVVLQLSKKIIDAKVLAQTKQYFLVGFFSIIAISVFTIFFVANSTRDIVVLTRFADMVGKGNLDIKVQVKSKDEIGQLATAFNKMVERLKDTMASRDRLSSEVDKRIKVEALLKHLSTTDELTQVYNRRAFNDFAQQLMTNFNCTQDSFSIALLDIDHFKHINDSYGHDIGDQVLVKLAEVILNNIREADILSRWGGEEFTILMPQVDGDAAFHVAERLRLAIKETEFIMGIPVTVSVGVTQFKPTDTLYQLIKRADDAQYRAKSCGRDNVQKI